jgi:glutaminyl-peptide cyclotransferase
LYERVLEYICRIINKKCTFLFENIDFGMNILKKISLLIVGVFVVYGCKTKDAQNSTEGASDQKAADSSSAVGTAFDADSAFAFTAKQVSFGPRVPGSIASKNCGKWMISKLKAYGFEVIEQNFTATIYDGKKVASKNIIGSTNPNAQKRIMLAAHYDSRPMSDKDPGIKTQPIDGANDGASGVAVALELARIIQKDKLSLGVDIVFFDTEDWGLPNDYSGNFSHDYGGYCLGSEYWSKNLHKAGYTAYYGILFDMVGGKGAQFRKDAFSMQVASSIVNSIWDNAQQLGYANYFINTEGGGITDDHVPVATNAKIPMVDIIDNRPTDNLFFEHHHTTKDNMDAIDKNVLKAVGQTVFRVLHLENQSL